MKDDKGISLISVIIAILLIAILIALIWVGIVFKNVPVDNGPIADGEQIKEEDFDYMLVEYILDSIEVYSSTGYILKDIDGDVTAERLSYEEAKANRAEYKVKIMNMLSNPEIFGNKFKIENKEACTFNFVKILTELGIGTHMGVGIGFTDFEGNKLYIYNNKVIASELGQDADEVIVYFGCNINELKNHLLDKLEEQVIKGKIVKSIDNSKLTVEELKEYRQKEFLPSYYELYYKDGLLTCKYYFDDVLQGFGLENTEKESKMETFVFTKYTIYPRYYQTI